MIRFAKAKYDAKHENDYAFHPLLKMVVNFCFSLVNIRVIIIKIKLIVDSMASREDYIYYARLAEQGERYEDMIKYMKIVSEVRNLLHLV